MDPVDAFLDRVCRGVGGPRELRQHLRRELREHLLDAAAGHRAAGLSEADAVAKAIADFGGPDEVRAELEATHGHRLLSVLVDKAMQWKENTVKAKWVWSTWAYLAVAGVVLFDVLFVWFAARLQVPKLQKLTSEGWLQFDERSEPGISWAYSFLNNVRVAWDGAFWWLLALAAAWGVFEWRVRSENKPAMRLAGLGTLALGLTVVVVLVATCLFVPVTLGLPGSKIARPWAVEAVTSIDAAVAGLDAALEKKDWDTMRDRADRANEGLARLNAGPAVGSLATWNIPPTHEELRETLDAAKAALADVRAAVRDRDVNRVAAGLRKFRTAFAPVREAAYRPDR